MQLNDFITSISKEYLPIERELFQRAYAIAEKAHGTQKRASGEPYMIHCKAVASILTEMNAPPAVVAAGLLHDTVEDTKLTFEDLEKEFGKEIAELVQAVTKLDTLPRVTRSNHYREGENEEDNDGQGSSWRAELASVNLRKTFLAMADDPRVVLIKLADRLHNMRTLNYLRPEKQKRIAQETMDLFAPLASRLGISQIQTALEDLSFQYIEPDTYKDITNQLDERRSEREREMTEIITDVKDVMGQASIDTEVSGRPKHIYSIYRKMRRNKVTIKQLHDLRGVRIIVPSEEDCYATVGIIHSNWRPLPGEFDDYIAAPKPNLYKSIHSSVVYKDGKALEVQIRTPEMDRNAEYGIAAHWRYKEGEQRDTDFEHRVTYLRQMLEWQKEVETAQEYVNGLKIDVFGDRVYTFTPQGDIIDLPVGSTPIDFAYNIHTEVGHRCRGAKVNGKLVSLDYKLSTGEQVEILTSKRGGPSRDWLNENLELVKTQRARSKIRRWFKHQERDKNKASGEALLKQEVSRLGLDHELDLEKLAEIFNYQTPEDLLVAIGCGDISIGRVVNGLVTFVDGTPIDVPAYLDADISRETSSDITVLGLQGLRNRLAGCCNPTPGDEIIGYITRGRGATIHRKDCANILNTSDPERLVEVTWGSPHRTFPVPIQVHAYDRTGLTRDIATLLANNNVPMTDLHVDVDEAKGEAVFDILVGVKNVKQLRRILDLLVRLNNIYDARRVQSA
ncbi:MAG: GTP pyrophosphokinase [Chloroflexi bacterium]|nr:GTP pyrophosphokinase [Chloroflexota bacterium]